MQKSLNISETSEALVTFIPEGNYFIKLLLVIPIVENKALLK